MTRLTAHFICGQMLDLMICKLSMVMHDTDCPYRDQVSLQKKIYNNPAKLKPIGWWLLGTCQNRGTLHRFVLSISDEHLVS